MAGGTGVPPMLALRRSPQSGTKTMTAAWAVVYTDVSASTLAYLFGGAVINLTPMLAGDTIDIRIRKRLVSGGDLVNHDQRSYSDVQPTDHVLVEIRSIPDVFGVEISMRQTAGVLADIETEFSAAKILGTS